MLTLVSALYILDSKFNIETYESWMCNLLTNVNNFRIIIYTNNETYPILALYECDKVIIVIKELEELSTYYLKENGLKTIEIIIY